MEQLSVVNKEAYSNPFVSMYLFTRIIGILHFIALTYFGGSNEWTEVQQMYLHG